MAESTGAIVTAIAANLAIAAAKFAGAALTGSSAMLAEGVHSVVDTANEALLLVGLHRAKRPPNRRHPFGHGREVYFYAFVVSLLIFSVGGVYSIYEGVEKITHPEAERAVHLLGITVPGLEVNLAILAFAVVAEGYSLSVALRGMPADRRYRPLSAIHRSKDPSLFVVLAEDAAAVAGLLLAICGVLFSRLLDMPALDGGASVAIGLLLVAMAVFLMVETHGLLIGEAADPALVAAIEALMRTEPAVRHVNEVLTQHLGPQDILVNVSLDVDNKASGGDVEALVGRLDAGLREAHADVRRIFIEIQARDRPAREAPQAERTS